MVMDCAAKYANSYNMDTKSDTIQVSDTVMILWEIV